MIRKSQSNMISLLVTCCTAAATIIFLLDPRPSPVLRSTIQFHHETPTKKNERNERQHGTSKHTWPANSSSSSESTRRSSVRSSLPTALAFDSRSGRCVRSCFAFGLARNQAATGCRSRVCACVPGSKRYERLSRPFSGMTKVDAKQGEKKRKIKRKKKRKEKTTGALASLYY